MIRTCGTVRAGVLFFPAPGFLREEPGGDQREGLMMMPAAPRANFVIGQAGFALASLQAFFDAVLGLADAREFGQGGVVRGVRQVVVVLQRSIPLTLAN